VCRVVIGVGYVVGCTPEDGHINAPKHVQLIYDNKLQLLHQIGSSRHSPEILYFRISKAATRWQELRKKTP
jgi:hypothetical protein